MIVELAASQFLARIGAQGIPLYYLLNAAVSIPFATLFSSVMTAFRAANCSPMGSACSPSS